MKKPFFFLIIILIVSCEKEYSTAYKDELLYYPFFEEYDKTIAVVIGNEANLESVNATVRDEKIPAKVTKTISYINDLSELKSDVQDVYIQTLSVRHPDTVNWPKITSESNRTVYVVSQGDFANSIAGLYKVTNISRGGVALTNTGYYILISKLAGDEYSISHSYGSYYETGKGYGANYRDLPIKFTVKDIATNSFDFSGRSSVVWPARGKLGETKITDIVLDASSKSITISFNWSIVSSGIVIVKMTQLSVEEMEKI